MNTKIWQFTSLASKHGFEAADHESDIGFAISAMPSEDLWVGIFLVHGIISW